MSKNLITEEIIFQLKKASPKQKEKIRNILTNNYKKLVDEIISEADYATVISYWKDFTPSSKPIMKTKDFIKKYSKIIK